MRLGTSAETNVPVSADVVSVTVQIDFKTNCDVSTNFSEIQKYQLRFPSQHEQSEAPSGPVLRSHRVTGYTDRAVCVSKVRNAVNFVISPRCCSTLHKKLIKKNLRNCGGSFQHFRIVQQHLHKCFFWSLQGRNVANTENNKLKTVQRWDVV